MKSNFRVYLTKKKKLSPVYLKCAKTSFSHGKRRNSSAGNYFVDVLLLIVVVIERFQIMPGKKPLCLSGYVSKEFFNFAELYTLREKRSWKMKQHHPNFYFFYKITPNTVSNYPKR